MHRFGLAVSLLILITAGPGEAETLQCGPSPRRDGVDLSLPCIALSPIAEEDAVIHFALERAEVARAYLVGKGIDARRIVAVGRDYSISIVTSADGADLAPLRQVRTELPE